MTEESAASPNANETSTAEITPAVTETVTVSAKAKTMGDVGPPKDLLRERIKNKRANEGLEDIPPEQLFPKRPRYNLSPEEKDRLSERRKRNKEAAEKSRKKKKEEFEKLQSENDQLAQDKCEMAAMIETLKKDVQKLVKENTELRTSSEGLKRWVAKRAHQLGLVEKAPESSTKAAEKEASEPAGKAAPLTRGDPSLHSAAEANPDTAAEAEMSPPTPPVSPPSLSLQLPKAENPSPPPAHQQSPRLILPLNTLQMPHEQEFKVVGLYTPKKMKKQGHQSPWIVQQPAAVAEAMDSAEPEDLSVSVPQENDVMITNVTEPTPLRPIAPKPIVIKPGVSLMSHAQRAEEQQVIYLPKDMIFVVDNNLPAMSFGLPAQSQPVYSTADTSKTFEGQPVEILPAAYAASLPMPLPLSMPIAVSGSGGVGRVYRGDAVYTSPSPRPPKGEYRAVEVSREVAMAPVAAAPAPAPSRLADPEVVTAIESLLKLGYKVEMAPQEHVYQAVPHGYVTVSAPGLVEASGTLSLKTAI